MKHGEHEFHELSARILDRISAEGLRIARENHWQSVGIRVTHSRPTLPGKPRALRCHLVKTIGASTIDEPTATLLDAANELFDLFKAVGTPLASMTMDWNNEGANGGMQRVSRYTYH